MNRREVIKSLGLVAGHTMMPSLLFGFLESCKSGKKAENYQPLFFTPEELQWMGRIVEIIIPPTETKSGSEVGCHHFLDQVFTHCLTLDQQKVIKDGFTKLIVSLQTNPEHLELITEIDQKAFAGEEPFAYFKTIKHYTMVAYFTSKEGETKASDYQKNPGGYKAEIPLNTETKNQGKTSLHYYF